MYKHALPIPLTHPPTPPAHTQSPSTFAVFCILYSTFAPNITGLEIPTQVTFVRGVVGSMSVWRQESKAGGGGEGGNSCVCEIVKLN